MTAPSELSTGWTLVLACAIGVGLSAVALPFYTIGVLVEPLQNAFGWSRSDIQQAILFSTGCGALSAPLIGLLVDRFGVRAVTLPGIIGLAAAFAAASQITQQVWTLYAAYAGIAILGAGTNPVTWTRAIAGFFKAQRGLALGLALTGTGGCAIAAPLLAEAVLTHYGWRAVYLALALLVLSLSLPCSFFFLKDRSGQNAGHTMAEWGLSLSDAVKTYRFWVLLSSIFLVYLAVSGIIPNLIPALTDRGYTRTSAAGVASLIGGALIAGRLAVGWLVDRFWAPGVAAIATGLPIIACLLFVHSDALWAISLAAILVGFAGGAELDLLAYFTARYFGLRHYARLYGILYIGLAVAGGAAPALFALGLDWTGSYAISFNTCAVLFGASAVLILLLGRYPTALSE